MIKLLYPNDAYHAGHILLGILLHMQERQQKLLSSPSIFFMKKKLIQLCCLLLFLIFSTFHSFAQLSGFYQEDFEGSFPPEDWQVKNILDPSYHWQQSPYEVYSGSHSVYIGSAIGQGEDWLILPQFSVAATDSFSFWLTAESLGFTDSTIILVSTTDDDLSSFTSVIATLSDGVNYHPVANLYQYHAYSLSPFAGQDVFVAFKNRNYEGDGVYIDLVSIGSQLGTGVIQGIPQYSDFSAHPNPFTNSTIIFFSIDRASTVRISIVNSIGNEVAVLCNGLLAPGSHQFNWSASTCPSGVYFCKVIVDGTSCSYHLLKLQ